MSPHPSGPSASSPRPSPAPAWSPYAPSSPATSPASRASSAGPETSPATPRPARVTAGRVVETTLKAATPCRPSPSAFPLWTGVKSSLRLQTVLRPRWCRIRTRRTIIGESAKMRGAWGATAAILVCRRGGQGWVLGRRFLRLSRRRFTGIRGMGVGFRCRGSCTRFDRERGGVGMNDICRGGSAWGMTAMED